jgi:hypothetical protein
MGNNIYGKPKQTAPPPSLITTAPSLQEQITILEKRKTHLERLIEINAEKARDAKTKDEAYRYLKLKTTYANELKSIFGMLDKLEGLDNARQRLHFQKNTLEVTQQVTTVIKQNTVDVGNAEDIMDNVREAIEDVDRVSEVLGRTEPPSEELQKELDDLFERPAPVQEPAAQQPEILQFPEVPQQKPVSQMDRELRMLASD